MPWPTLEESYRITDWSYFQMTNSITRRPYDIDKFCEENPHVDGAVVRFCWPSGVKDPKYDHYYDGFTRNGKIVMGYGWPNVYHSVARVLDDWERAMGDRVPKVIFGDWEEASSITGATPARITNHLKALNDGKHQRFPSVVHGEYGRGGWLDNNMIWDDSMRQLNWWIAHWIWGAPDFNRQAHSFAEMDAWLPIGNSFTPNRGRVARILVESVKGWQATSRLKYLSRGNLDGGYFTREFIDPIYNGGTEPQPPTKKAIVEVTAEVVQGEAEIVYK